MFLVWYLMAMAALALGALMARFTFWAVTIRGHSMEPTLHDGDLVIAMRRWSSSMLRRGDMVLVKGYGGASPTPASMMVKRVSHLAGDHVQWSAGVGCDRTSSRDSLDSGKRALGQGEVFVLADNQSGIDSRTWGPIPISAVAAVVLWNSRRSDGRSARTRPGR